MMKTTILTFSDSNMARSSWRWKFFLEVEKSGAYTLSCEQIVEDDDAMTIEPVSGLRRGADVYDALDSMLANAGSSLEEGELPTIAAKIAKLDKGLAEQFERGPKLLERRDAAAAKRAAINSDAKLSPYRSIIEEYVVRFSDSPLRYPGGASYGTQRNWAKCFIEQYVIENGELPSGSHRIVVRVGGTRYSGATHDFSDLREARSVSHGVKGNGSALVGSGIS